MFKGKIRKCLKCGEEGEAKTDTNRLYLKKWWVSCKNNNNHTTEDTHDHQYQSVNEWNRANTPPEEVTYILHFYARFGMRLP